MIHKKTAFNYKGERMYEVMQYDSDVYFYISDKSLTEVFPVHFCIANSDNEALIVDDAEICEDGRFKVKIPNVLLMEPHTIVAYIYAEFDGGNRSIYRTEIRVVDRQRPHDYFDPTVEDYLSLEQIKKEAIRYINESADAIKKKMEEDIMAGVFDGKTPYIGENDNWFVWDNENEEYVDSGISSKAQIDKDMLDESVEIAVKDYFTENPIVEEDPTVPDWAKAKTKPTYTPEEIGAMPKNTFIPQDRGDDVDNLLERMEKVEEFKDGLPAWSQKPDKPAYLPAEVGAMPADTFIPKDRGDDVDDLQDRVAALEDSDAVEEMIREHVDEGMQDFLDSGYLANLTIQDGSVTRVKMAEDTEEALGKADTAMQPDVYDQQGLKVDIYSYAQGRADTVQYNLNKVKEEIVDAYSLTDTVKYNKLGDAIRGTIGLSRSYMQAILSEYKAFSIKIVDELPLVGEAQTFYLVQKDSGVGYDKYWFIENKDGVRCWDVFGASSTVVVRELPDSGEADVDYILQTASGCLYYKWIDNEWNIVAGSIAYVGEELPKVEDGSEFADYYVRGDGDIYMHYRFIDGVYRAIGGDSYTKEQVDQIQADLDADINRAKSIAETAQASVSAVSRSVDKLVQDIASMDVEGYTYYHTIAKDEDTGNYMMTLYQVKDGVEEIASQTVLPATGGGPGSSSTVTMNVERITQSPLVITTTDSAVIEVDFTCTDEDGESVDATYTWKNGTSIISTGSMIQGRNTFDMSEYCAIGTQKFTLTVTADGGSVSVKTWTIQKVDVRIESAFNDRYTNAVGRDVSFPYTPYGSVQKTVHFILDGYEIDTVTTSASGTLQSYTIPAQPHGSHLFECYITANVNNMEIETSHIYKDIIWYDEESDDPVIGCIYRNDYYGDVKAVQYNTTSIPYIVYDPRTNSPKVTLTVDGEVFSELTLSQANNVWAYKTSEVGKHNLIITCRTTSVTIVMDIEDLGVDLSPITGNLEFDFNPTGRSNSSANRLWEDERHSDIKMTVSDNFDWSNGGYQIDEDGNQYFLIKAGTRASINYNLFNGTAQSNIANHGMEFKVIFRVENVQTIDATWLTCLNDEKPVGLRLDAHEGYLMTSASDLSNSSSYLYMPYSEEDTIELEVNVNTLNQDDEDASSYIMSYEDGVGLKAMIYDKTHRLYQFNSVPITIGSDECDVRIYRMKAYSAALTDSNILTNFIADARDSDEMISRYNRNNIYDENGQLTPEHLAERCPQLRIIKIDAPYFTNDKKNFVKDTTVQCIYKGGDPVLDNWTFTNGYHSGQGTTSNEYGYAARNLDLIFNCDGIHDPNDKIKADPNYTSTLRLGDGTLFQNGTGNITLTRTSVGTNWLNIKVNVASSENANNALLQKRYNDFIPYVSLAQQRDPFVKNDMEFVNCVVFVRENSADIDSHREYQDREWHFYSIGNIGDSKKTDFSRAYDQNDINEFTLEVSDNTLNNSTFQTGVYIENGIRKIETPGEVMTDGDSDETGAAHAYTYPIAPSEWNENNGRYAALYADQFDGDSGSFELRYGCKGDFKDGKLVVKSDENKAQLLKNADVWRAFYRWVITSTDEEFVRDLDQWMIRESALYWYVFTHHFTMIDNRAKNTFWHFARTGKFRLVTAPVKELLHVYCERVEGNYIKTEDTEIVSDKQYFTEYAFDMWDYDNDTAIGINNSGELTMSYGKEDIDYKTDGVESSGWLFNAADSVFWCRLRDLMGSQCNSMYGSIDQKCWSASNIIQEFDNHQNEFPEELWRLDIDRKYIRTYQGRGMNGGNAAEPTPRFLRSMMQGRKKYQRRQWLRDQEAYFGTKHLTSNITSDQIMFRCNTPVGNNIAVRPNYTLNIVPYSDMYLSVMFGNSAPTQIRAKAGREYEIRCPYSKMDDTAVLIYCASKIQSLNDLSACYIHDNDFSKASKLKKLVIGSAVPGYNNSFLEILNMGNNELLEDLDIRNCGSLGGSLNLSSCNNLRRLMADGTQLTAITFSPNGKIESAHLPETVNSLTMRYLNYLTDLDLASWDNLETLTIYGGCVDMLSIVRETIDTVQTLVLGGVNWTLGDTELLNKILKMNSSVLSGSVYISGQIRNQEIESYASAWSDLEVTYNPQNLVQQYLVTFVNADKNHTVLHTQYVDRGSKPIDPYQNGDISMPTMESDAQYVYSFSGWEGIDNAVLNNTTVIANYDKEVRRYKVTWYMREGVPLGSVEAEYGDEVVYPGENPVNESEENAFIYNVFAGWDASTGCIRGDTDVYAIWDRAELPQLGKDLKDMTPAEIYAVTKSGRAENYFEQKDYFDMNLGNDFEFKNVESEILCENLMLDGKTAIDKDIRLFGEEEHSFTMAIDFQFGAGTTNGTLVSCFEENGAEGFRLRYNSGPNIQWGDKSINVGNVSGTNHYRDMVVIRHIAGENTLYIYHAASATADRFSPDVFDVQLTRTRATNTNNLVTLGAVRFVGDGGHDDYGKGCIYYCKIWHDDLGHQNALKLAQWCHEPLRMQYYGTGRYRLAGDTSQRSAASFIAANELSGRGYWMNSSNTNVGGWDKSLMRSLCNGRLYNAMPTVWKSMIKSVKIPASAGNRSSEVVISEDRVYLAAYKEADPSVNSEPYNSEGSGIPWYIANSYPDTIGGNMTANATRIKFRGRIIPDGARYFFGNSDPAQVSSNAVKPGDIWVHTGDSSIGYMFVKQSELDIMGVAPKYTSNGGGWVGASDWWLRSPFTGGTTFFWYVFSYGLLNYSYYATNVYGVCPCFSI